MDDNPAAFSGVMCSNLFPRKNLLTAHVQKCFCNSFFTLSLLWLEMKSETGVLSSKPGQKCVDEETVQYRFVLPRCSARTDGSGTPFKQLVQQIMRLRNSLRSWWWWWRHSESNFRTSGLRDPRPTGITGTIIFIDQFVVFLLVTVLIRKFSLYGPETVSTS